MAYHQNLKRDLGRKMTMEQFEKEARDELTEAQKKYRERTRKESARYQEATDSETWFAVSFNSRAQKEEALRLLGLDCNLKYVEGREFVNALHQTLTTPDIPCPKTRPIDKDYAALAREK